MMLKTPSYQPTHTDPLSSIQVQGYEAITGKTVMAAISRKHVMIL